MELDGDEDYDLIIGNPPYFVCKKEDVPEKYSDFIVGRPNMFGLFILHSLSKLKANGILAFVIPKSFLNSAYYASIRNYIKQTCAILNISDYSSMGDFLDTEQSTFGLILRKLDTEILSECNYSLQINGNYIFSPSVEELRSYFQGSTTLKQLGFAVKTGTIVWNEKKDLLTDSETETLLLYNTNITNDNKLKLTKFKNDEKKQYIQTEGSVEPVIVVNRGNGNAKYNFKYALIEIDRPFITENHLNVIYSQEKRPKPQLIQMYNSIITSFQNPKTKAFIELFFGNNGLSKTELETVLPIYL
jgi:adenine-specific DNA-methyltransferase